MPDAYFDTNLNGNLTVSTASRTLTGNISSLPTTANLNAFNATPYYLDNNAGTLYTNVVIRTLIVSNVASPTNTDRLAFTNSPAALPYRITRSPTIISRFTD